MQPVMTAALSFQDLLIVAAIFILLFGGKKVGEFGKGLGEGIRNFRSALKGDEEKEEKKDDTGVEVKK
jgi:sec-independent protein translocase protein TatA